MAVHLPVKLAILNAIAMDILIAGSHGWNMRIGAILDLEMKSV